MSSSYFLCLLHKVIIQMFNQPRKYKDHRGTRDTKIMLLARAKPTRGKPNNPSLIESDQHERYPRLRSRQSCHQYTKSNPPSKGQSQRWSNCSNSSQRSTIWTCNKRGRKWVCNYFRNFGLSYWNCSTRVSYFFSFYLVHFSFVRCKRNMIWWRMRAFQSGRTCLLYIIVEEGWMSFTLDSQVVQGRPTWSTCGLMTQ